jgi:hypothetical protein
MTSSLSVGGVECSWRSFLHCFLQAYSCFSYFSYFGCEKRSLMTAVHGGLHARYDQTHAAACLHAAGHRWRRRPVWPTMVSRSMRGPRRPARRPARAGWASARLDKGQIFRHPQPHLHVCTQGNQMRRGMRRRQNKDSHDSDQFPTLRCKIGPPFS